MPGLENPGAFVYDNKSQKTEHAKKGRENMKDKKLFVCPKCQEWYSCDAKKVPQPCPNCHITPLPVNIDYDYWQSMSQQQREECKKSYIKEHKLEMDATVDGRNYQQIKPRTSITLVHVMGTLVMLACVCTGIASGPLGLLIGIIGGFASAAGLWVFAGMAEDLQAMRQTVEYLSDTLSQIKKEQKNS